jgi:hypothetical protein
MKQFARLDLVERIFAQSLTGKGARCLSADGVEALFEFAIDKPYRLQIVEAHMIEPQVNRPMFQYSISGPIPLSGNGAEADKAEPISLFRELNAQAQKEKYPIRYDVWFSELSAA